MHDLKHRDGLGHYRTLGASALHLVEKHAVSLGIASFRHQLALPKRSVVFHHGDPAKHYYVVEQGTLSLLKYLEDGRRQLVEIIMPGGICGFSQDETYHATCETLEPAMLTVIRKSDVQHHPEICHQLQATIEVQICMLQQHALALGRMTAQERVCALLVTFMDAHLVSSCDGPGRMEPHDIHMPMTRAEMGDYLGLSLETVCRTLTELRREGLIEIGRHHGDITIFKTGRLKQLAGSSE